MFQKANSVDYCVDERSQSIMLLCVQTAAEWKRNKNETKYNKWTKRKHFDFVVCARVVRFCFLFLFYTFRFLFSILLFVVFYFMFYFIQFFVVLFFFLCLCALVTSLLKWWIERQYQFNTSFLFLQIYIFSLLNILSWNWHLINFCFTNFQYFPNNLFLFLLLLIYILSWPFSYGPVVIVMIYVDVLVNSFSFYFVFFFSFSSASKLFWILLCCCEMFLMMNACWCSILPTNL